MKIESFKTMFWVYLDHYLTRLGLDSTFRARFKTFRCRVVFTSVCVCLLLISAAIFAFYHHALVHKQDRMESVLNQVPNDQQNTTQINLEDIPKILDSNNSEQNGDRKTNFVTLDGNGIKEGNIKDTNKVQRSNSDVESTIHEIRSATWVISDELQEHNPFQRCVNFIESKVKGKEMKESKDFLNYCKGKFMLISVSC